MSVESFMEACVVMDLELGKPPFRTRSSSTCVVSVKLER